MAGSSQRVLFGLRIIIVIILVNISHGNASTSNFVIRNLCMCEGEDQVYECTVSGGGATIWRGSAFECLPANNKIVLLHTVNSTAQEMCNNGAISGNFIRTGNNSFTSQLTVRVTSALSGQSIILCAHDSGSVITEIGSSILTVTTEPYPPPSNIHLVRASPRQLIFQWSPISSTCQAIQYGILTTDCGICPRTTHHTSVSCTGLRILDNHQCSLAIQTIACDNVAGNKSRIVSVSLAVPAAPDVNVIPVYSYTTRNLSGIVTRFNKEENFNISEGIDGSPMFYTVNYTVSGTYIMCATSTISTSSCTNGVCEHMLEIPSSICPPSSSITVIVSGTNRLGEGQASNPVSIPETVNQFVTLLFDLAHNRLTCSFQQQQKSSMTPNNHVCTIAYGSLKGNCRAMSQSSASNFSDVHIGLLASNQMESHNELCFIVTASNGTSTAMVQGSFVTNCNPALLDDGTAIMYGSVTCPQPLITHSSGIENGIILCYTGTSVGSTAYYYCLSCDYKTISNSEVITKKTCMEDGSWRINVTTPQIECNCASESRPFSINGLSFGISVAVFALLISSITAIFLTIIVMLSFSRRALLNQLKAKSTEQHGIYEDIESVTAQPPSSNIDTEKNTAYILASDINTNLCTESDSQL